MARPSLLLLTAAASALAVVANAAAVAVPGQDAAKTRLGSSIEQDLSARDSAAARRKRGLDLREQAAKAAEARIQADLEARQKEAAAAGAMPGGEAPLPAEAQYDELARIYQAMKPAKAALVFEQLDMEVQMKVAQRMRANSTASILAAMTPRGAAALSMALARRNANLTRPRPAMANATLTPAGGATPPAVARR